MVMVQYLDKSALIAEIERRQNILNLNNSFGEGGYIELECFKHFLNTLKVKEVDLEEEFNDFLDNVEGVPPMWNSNEQIEWAKDIARHFFELGLKAKKEEIK